VEVVARYTTIAIRIEDEAIKSKKITGVLQIGNVDPMLEGIDGALGVQVNRVSPEFVSLSVRRNPHGNRCMGNNPFRNLFIL
jgi:ferric-dicitrate binding protein FerR (iron transport regulator)